jgi:hypothetical protein
MKGCGLAWAVIALALVAPSRGHADDATINDLKAKIFDANMAKQTFVKGAKFCKDLDGTTNFYFEPRDRVLNLQDYHRSLESLAKEQAYNGETRRPWNEQDASARWDQAQKEAAKDKANCDLIASLPFLEKKLQELEGRSSESGAKPLPQ